MRLKRLALLAGMFIILTNAVSTSTSKTRPVTPEGGVEITTAGPFRSSGTFNRTWPKSRVRAFLGSNTVAPTIDGAATPEAIPDRVAYRHFVLSAIALRSGGHEGAVRQRAVLHALGLSPTDTAALGRALISVGNRMDAISEMKDPVIRRSNRTALLDGAVGELHSSLSAGGAERLGEYVQRVVKPGIQIYGEVPR